MEATLVGSFLFRVLSQNTRTDLSTAPPLPGNTYRIADGKQKRLTVSLEIIEVQLSRFLRQRRSSVITFDCPMKLPLVSRVMKGWGIRKSNHSVLSTRARSMDCFKLW